MLSPAETDQLEDVCAAWSACRDSCPAPQELISLALRRLEQDLFSGVRGEVIEELRREIEYRQWRTENCISDRSPRNARPQPVNRIPENRTKV